MKTTDSALLHACSYSAIAVAKAGNAISQAPRLNLENFGVLALATLLNLSFDEVLDSNEESLSIYKQFIFEVRSFFARSEI
jgi:hypothetical protein